MTGWLDTMIQGVMLGGLYALFAAGLSLIFGIMRLVNLAHGDLIVLAAFVILVARDLRSASIRSSPTLSRCRACSPSALRCSIVLLNRTLGRDMLPPLLVTFGLSIIIQNGLLEAFSADSQRLRLGAIETASIPLGGGIAVGVMPLLTLAVGGRRDRAASICSSTARALGRAFRATSDDPEIAQLMGIDHRRIFAVAMGIAMVVIAIAALYLGMRANFDPTIGPARLIYAFEAVIIGGLGSLWGTLAGGIIIGVAQTIGARINPEWQILAGHLAFLVVLVLRPRGLFPRAHGLNGDGRQRRSDGRRDTSASRRRTAVATLALPARGPPARCWSRCPAFAGRALIQDLIFVFYMLALAQCWNLLAGYAGLVSVGQQAFVGLGGYLLFALTI